MQKIYTIGFTKKSAETFFTILIDKGVSKIIDVRLNNVSQLAGFTKMNDLKYFLKSIGGIEYEHMPALAPTAGILEDYKKKRITWADLEQQFKALLKERKVKTIVETENLHNSCLLCSEPSAEKCHRRLVAEYLKKTGDEITIEHL